MTDFAPADPVTRPPTGHSSSLRTRAASPILLALALLAGASGCGSNPSAPAIDRSGRVTGRVQRADTSAATDADIYATGLFVVDGETPFAIGFSDSTGHFTIQNLPPGLYVLHATSPDGTVDAESVSVAHQATATAAMHLAPAGTFKGTVTLDNATTHAGTIVEVVGLFSFAFTDSLGAFRLGDVAPGTWPIRAQRAGYSPASWTGVLTAPGDSVSLPGRVLVHLSAQP
jgi:hypothetical protein